MYRENGDLPFVLANKYFSNLNVFEMICWIIIIMILKRHNYYRNNKLWYLTELT